MSIFDLLSKLEELGITLEVVDSGLKVHGPKGRLTPDLIAELRDKKKELTALLQRRPQKGKGYMSIESAEKKEYYLLSSAQKRLYILQQMNPGNIAYNMPEIIPLPAEFDWGKVDDTFKKLIKRHESLRTSFHMMANHPVQVVHDEVEFEIEYHKVEIKVKVRDGDSEWTRGLAPLPLEPAARRSQHAISTIKNFVRSFDLSNAPLLRVGLMELPHTPTALRGHPRRGTYNSQEGIEHKYILIVDMHHIISDGVSHEILVKDFLSLYEGKDLLPLRVQYKDFSGWQNGEKKKENLKRQEEYWMKEFAGEIPVLELAADYARPVVQSFEGDSVNFQIAGEETHALNAVALKGGYTLFMVLVALFNILLSKLSSQEEIIIGSPIAGRRHADLEKIIGMFVNTLSLRNYPVGDQSFRDFLANIKERMLLAFENQEYPFEELVDKLSVKRDIGRNPLFDVMFVLQNMNRGIAAQDKEVEIETSRLVQPGLPKEYENVFQTTKFDLTLTAMEISQGLFLSFQYCTKLFKKETIERFIIYFKKIESIAVKEPDIRINDIEIVSEEEQKKILYDFNDTEAGYPKDKTIHRLFEEQVESTPDHTVLVGSKEEKPFGQILNAFGGIHLTYGKLDERSGRLGQLLIEIGIQPDNIVGIMVERSIEMVIGILGILKAGGAYMPIEPDYPEGRIDYMLKDSSAKILLTEKELTGWLSSSLEPHINLSEGRNFTNDPLAYILYTSGSTGKPKGVMVEHRNVIRLVKNTDYIDFQPGDRILQTGALEFDASTFEIWGALLNGLILYLESKENILNPRKLKNIITGNHITMMWLTSQLFNHMVQVNANIFVGLRYLLVGGDVLSPHHIDQTRKRFPGLHIINGYGPTENTTFSTTFAIEKEYREKIPIGRPIANSSAYIVVGAGKLQPIGIVGEIWVGGDGVSRGYMNNPELTAEKFDHDLWDYLDYQDEKQKSPGKRVNMSCASYRTYIPKKIYKTGDLARWLPDGNIEFLGRIDHQVKIRGFRVELGEIESQLMKHMEIKEAVVFARSSENGDRYLCAYITSSRDFPVSELKEYLLDRLPGYMIPSEFMLLEKIPLTNSGKVDRQKLYSSGKKLSTGIEHVAPQSANEIIIAAAWKNVLKLEEVGIYDNFFDMGGTSLDMIRLNNKLTGILKREIPIIAMYRYTTIDSFARFLEGRSGETEKNPAGTRSQARVDRIKKGMEDKNKRREIRSRRNK